MWNIILVLLVAFVGTSNADGADVCDDDWPGWLKRISLQETKSIQILDLDQDACEYHFRESGCKQGRNDCEGQANRDIDIANQDQQSGEFSSRAPVCEQRRNDCIGGADRNIRQANHDQGSCEHTHRQTECDGRESECNFNRDRSGKTPEQCADEGRGCEASRANCAWRYAGMRNAVVAAGWKEVGRNVATCASREGVARLFGIGSFGIAAIRTPSLQFGHAYFGHGRLVWVDTSSREDYPPAHRMYSTAGYRQVARLEDYYAADDAKLIFSKETSVPVSDDSFQSSIG